MRKKCLHVSAVLECRGLTDFFGGTGNLFAVSPSREIDKKNTEIFDLLRIESLHVREKDHRTVQTLKFLDPFVAGSRADRSGRLRGNANRCQEKRRCERNGNLFSLCRMSAVRVRMSADYRSCERRIKHRVGL